MMPAGSPHVVFTGGGTGGHLFPGLAVARQLAQLRPSVRITFAGSGKPFEKELVEAADFDYVAVPCRALPRRLSGVIPFLADNLTGYRAAGRFLDSHRVSAVVGTGGYASVPTARAAVRRSIPLVLLEQNAVPGRATRWLARSAEAVCTAFQEASKHLPAGCPVRVTGNPVRDGFSPATEERIPLAVRTHTNPKRKRGTEDTASLALRVSVTSPKTDSPTRSRSLLILGGSNGARSLNRHLPPALKRVGTALAGWRIVHQSGAAELAATRRLYQQLGVEASVLPFIAHMPRLLAQCDLAICRAGGTTLAELACCGLPAILLPYPHAADNHQRKNADAYSAAGGCLTLDERDLGGQLEDRLVAAVSKLVGDEQKRNHMSAALGRLAKPNAACDVAALADRLIGRDSHRAAA